LLAYLTCTRGCVSGKTLQHVRDNLTRPGASAGEYDWDFLDGLEDMPEAEKNKIKLAITEGKIADEDWKGVSAVWHPSPLAHVLSYD
jgi:hypothetical protein